MIENLKNNITKVLNIDDFDKRVEIINELRELIHELSPFKNEPVDVY